MNNKTHTRYSKIILHLSLNINPFQLITNTFNKEYLSINKINLYILLLSFQTNNSNKCFNSNNNKHINK